MDSLNFGTKNILMERLFAEKPSDPQWSAFDRWYAFANSLLNSDNIVPLWADKNFRWGYQLVMDIRDGLDHYNPLNLRKSENLPTQEEVIEEIGKAFSQEDSDEECCKVLLKGVEILRAEGAMKDSDLVEVSTDLQLFLVIAQKAREFRDIEGGLNQELEKVLKVEA